MQYITGKQAQLILSITTRQGLHKIVKEKNITVKSQGAGKPNLYLESDVKFVAENTNAQRLKTNPKLKKTVEKKKKIIENFENIEADKKLEEIRNNQKKDIDIKKTETKEFQENEESKTILTEIGKKEYLRAKELLTKNNTFHDVDEALIQAYAISYQNYFTFNYEITKRCGIDVNEAGEKKPTMYIGMAKEAFNQMSKLAQMIGIGARNRIGLEITKDKKASVFDILNSDDDF